MRLGKIVMGKSKTAVPSRVLYTSPPPYQGTWGSGRKYGLAWDGSYLWSSGSYVGVPGPYYQISKVDVSTFTVSPVGVGGSIYPTPGGTPGLNQLIYDSGYLYQLGNNNFSPALSKIDVSTSAVVAQTSPLIGTGTEQNADNSSYVWYTVGNGVYPTINTTIIRLLKSTTLIDASSPAPGLLGTDPQLSCYDDVSSVWILNGYHVGKPITNQIVKVSATTNLPVGTPFVTGAYFSYGLVSVGSYMWVIDNNTSGNFSRLIKIDKSTDAITVVDVDSAPGWTSSFYRQMHYDGSHLWIVGNRSHFSGAYTGLVVKVDPVAGTVVEKFEIPGWNSFSQGLTIGPHLWVNAYNGNTGASAILKVSKTP